MNPINYEFPHCEFSSSPYSHPSSVKYLPWDLTYRYFQSTLVLQSNHIKLNLLGVSSEGKCVWSEKKNTNTVIIFLPKNLIMKPVFYSPKG